MITNEELVREHLIAPMQGWIPQRLYEEVYREKPAAIRMRIATGKWVAGVHYSDPDGGARWLCVPEILKWVKNDKTNRKPQNLVVRINPRRNKQFRDCSEP
jgi:hypothetical protein